MPERASGVKMVGMAEVGRWKGSGCKFLGTKGKRYKLFWMTGEQRSDGTFWDIRN